MNYQVQPSAVGLASQALNDFIKNKAQIDVALSELSTTVNDSQLKMGKAASDHAFAAGIADSEAMKKSAIGNMAGAGMSMLTAGGALYKQHNYAAKAAQGPTDTQIKVDQVKPKADAAPAINPDGIGETDITAQNKSPGSQPPAGGNNADGNQGNNQAGTPELTDAQKEAKYWQDIWSNIGMHYPGALSKMAEGAGNVVATGDKMDQAAANRDMNLEQTIQTMMKAQSDLLSSAAQGNDNSASNTVQLIQALIQANRAG